MSSQANKSSTRGRACSCRTTRRSPGGLRLSVNDGGARPDTVALRLAQAQRLIEEDAP